MKPAPLSTLPLVGKPTLRSLATTLNLSRTTVSDALQGNSRVSAETTRLVRAAAQRVGYQPNQLASAVMSQIRKSRTPNSTGTIAVIEHADAPPTPAQTIYSDALHRGITEKCLRFGFQVERFSVGRTGLRLSRLDQILTARGIQGLLLMPCATTPDFSALRWSRYTALYLDYFIERPRLHSVCPDHFRAMVDLLAGLARRGYEKPGLCLDGVLDRRLHHRWRGAFLSQAAGQRVPILDANPLEEKEFREWFTRFNPDVVLGHAAQVIRWMEQCGAVVPATHGFVGLNHLMAPTGFAALDLQAKSIGSRAAELLLAQLLHGDLGVPKLPCLTTLPGRFLPGKTVRRETSRRGAETPVALSRSWIDRGQNL